MRFIVDLYRWLILLFLAIDLIGASGIVFWLAMGPLAGSPIELMYIAAIAGVAIIIVLGLGITATFISIHDRIAEISNHSRRAAEALEMSAVHHSEIAQ